MAADLFETLRRRLRQADVVQMILDHAGPVLAPCSQRATTVSSFSQT